MEINNNYEPPDFDTQDIKKIIVKFIIDTMLSKFDREIILYIESGLSEYAIAKKFDVSRDVIKHHKRNAFKQIKEIYEKGTWKRFKNTKYHKLTLGCFKQIPIEKWVQETFARTK